MKHLTSALAITIGLTGIAGLPSSARATFIQYTGSGTSAGVPVAASADFTTSAGQVSLTLQNTTVHTADAGQLLTGIRFTLAPIPGSVATMTSATAIPRTIAANGSYVDGASQSILNTWESGFSGGVYQLDFNPNAEFGIVGPADGETASVAGNYALANGSIKANPGHNPFTAKSATFTLSSAGITAGTTVTGVTFIYNTGLSTFINATQGTPPPAPVPEPSTVGFGLAVLGACGAARRRKSGVLG